MEVETILSTFREDLNTSAFVNNVSQNNMKEDNTLLEINPNKLLASAIDPGYNS
jgi:hypothetical protein